MTKYRMAQSIVLALTLMFWFAFLLSAQSVRPTAGRDVHHDVSQPLSEMIKNAPPPSSERREVEPLKLIPLPAGVTEAKEDPVIQVSTALPPTPPVKSSFEGLGNGQYGLSITDAPPDTNAAVGATQYVQAVNSSFAIFTKSTRSLRAGPIASKTLWSGFGGGCETNTNDGGGLIVLYDKLGQRWIFNQFSVSATPYLQCIAVSTTSDATGTYNRYSFQYSNIDDHPTMGVWSDAYYETFNEFAGGTTFAGAGACAFDRSAMLAGAAATQVCFQHASSIGGLLPSDLDGTTAPPAGSPNYMLSYGTNVLNLYKFHVDFVNTANATFTGPTIINVAPFTPLGDSVPQLGTADLLDSLSDRLMYRLAYRNFGTHESLVTNHTVATGSGSGIRWYEIRNPSGAPVVAQQSTFAPDPSYRWMGSVAMDSAEDLAVGYSVSSSTLHPSIRYAGRVPTDPASTLEPEVDVVTGGGSQTDGMTRWGDYSAMQVDPTDDCTFWYTQEYLKTTGSYNWNTRIASFRFPGCKALERHKPLDSSTTTVSSSLNPSTYGQAVTFTATVMGDGADATGTVQFTLNGSNVGSPVTLNEGFASSTATFTTSTGISSQLSLGNNTVTATYSGNYAGSTGTLSGGQVVTTGSQTIICGTAPPSSEVYDGTFNVSCTSDSGLNVALTWSGSACATGSATTSASITMTSGTGSCGVNANQLGNADFSAATQVSYTVNATLAQQQWFDLSSPSNQPSTAPYGSSFYTVTGTTTYEVAPTYTASGVCSNGPTTETINGIPEWSSTYTMTSGTGTCTIHVSIAGNNDFAAFGPINLDPTTTATKATNTVTFTSPAPASAEYGSSFTISASGLGTGAISYSSDGVVCTNSGATYTMISGTGNCTATATQSADPNYLQGSASASVTAESAVATVTVTSSSTNNTSMYGTSVTFTATLTTDTGQVKSRKPKVTVKPKDVNGAISWSPNTGCSTSAVSGTPPQTATCTTTSLGGGSDTVIATYTANDGNHNSPASGSVSQTVDPASQTIMVTTPAPPSVVKGSTFTVMAAASSGLPVAFTVSGACTNSGGAISMSDVAHGTCMINMNQGGNGDYQTATQVTETTTIALAQMPMVSFTGAPATAVYGTDFEMTTTTNASTTAVITAAGSCTVNGSRVTMTEGMGMCTLKASWAADDVYKAATATQKTTGEKASTSVTWATPSAITWGTALSAAQLNASGSVPGATTYSPASGKVLTAGTQTLNVTFKPTATSDYSDSTASVQLVVSQATTTTAITSTSANPSVVGHAIVVHYSVASSGKATGSVTVTASSGETCTGTVAATTGLGSCMIKLETVGSITLTAAYGGDANDTSSTSAGFTQTVNP
jgi:hypothetical protein